MSIIHSNQMPFQYIFGYPNKTIIQWCNCRRDDIIRYHTKLISDYNEWCRAFSQSVRIIAKFYFSN